ncbi:MAG: class B sortase [Lachnospiraceae bacterium]|nr:class B sortase [Lachnospiraceae bacterium]
MKKGLIRGTVKLNDSYQQVGRTEFAPLVFASLYIVFLLCASIVGYDYYYEGYSGSRATTSLRSRREAEDGENAHPGMLFLKELLRKNKDNDPVISIVDDDYIPVDVATSDEIPVFIEQSAKEVEEEDKVYEAPAMLPEMQELYEKNNDLIGYLSIEGTVIDYPVMQTMNDEEYYLDRDFNKNYSSAGCLIMDTDSTVGDGTKLNYYKDGTSPSTNLIIHGHNMRNGSMFGSLDKWRKEDYEKEHRIIKFKSLYEEREYEVISVFLSQVYNKSQNDVFKYYKFFEAGTKEEFDDFYINIKRMGLYDTGVTAEFGDEFITLSVCAYHVDNGRLVVVGKRVK